MVVLKFNASRIEPDFDQLFLGNREGSTLGTACARSETDFHVTGSKFASNKLLTSNGAGIEIELDEGYYEIDSETNTIHLSDRLRLNATTSRLALGIDGTVVDTMSGQASALLKDLFLNAKERKSLILDVKYSNWSSTSATVDANAPKIFDGDLLLNPTFYTELEYDERAKSGQKVLEKMYTDAVKLRELVLYKPAPNLSKAVMAVPVGVDSMMYDAASNVVDRPPSLNHAEFNSLIGVCLKRELAVDEPGSPAVSIEAFLTDTAHPSFAAAAHSVKVANAMSILISHICAYRVDGRACVMPNGVVIAPSESWKAEASRTKLVTADDCEGDAANLTALLYAADDVARDPNLASQYPFAAAVSNAFAHHMPGVCVLAANAGNADSAGENGHDAVAGHAICLLPSKPAALQAMLNGIASTAAMHGGADDDAQKDMTSKMKGIYARGLYHDEDIERMPVEERAMVRDADTLLSKVGVVPKLAIEGTSPVASSKLYESDTSVRLAQSTISRTEKVVSEHIGPSVTRAITRLHVPTYRGAPDHAFFKDLVEFSVPLRRSGMFKSNEVRDAGMATGQWVFSKPSDVTSAGVTPKEMEMGDFSMLPLWKLERTDAEIMDDVSSESLQNAMPMRKGTQTLSVQQSKNYSENVKALKDLGRSKANSTLDGRPLNFARHIVSFAAMINNADGVKHFVRGLHDDPTVAVRVEFERAEGLVLSHDGLDVGELPFIYVAKI